MSGKNLLRTGMFWSLVAAICCFIPKEVTFDPFDGDKSVHSARRSAKRDMGYRASAATTPRDGFGPAKPGFSCPLEQRYDPLVVYLDHGVERALPADMKKPVKWVKGYFLWYYPILVVLFVGVGLSAFVGWLDYALFPILFAAMGLVAQALWLNSSRAGASPRPIIIITLIVLSALLIWLQFRFALSISLAAAGSVLVYGLYLRRTQTS